MKQYNIKPIRIRFISGGVECASLTQLRNNFVPKDVKDSYPQFLKWLRQNKEEDVINGLIASKDVLNEDNQDSLFCLYSILYKEYLFDNSIEDLYELFLKWHHNNKNNNTFIHLREEINSREWGELFFLDVVQKHIVSQTDIVSSSSSLFEIYKDFLFDYFENKKISNLIELYIHLASKSLYKENFVFLDNTIKSQEWQTNFYLELIPHLFLPNQKNKSKQSTYNLAFQTNINSLVNTVIVNSRAHVSDKVKGCGSNSYILLPLENISASFKSEDETYSFYKFFLGDFLSENKYNKLSDICLYFLESYMQNDNFKVLQEIIKTSEWKFDFTKDCFPLIVEKIQQGIKLCPSKHTVLSVDNVDQVFDIYKLFLEDFFRVKHLTNLKGLYEFWNSNKNNKAFKTNNPKVLSFIKQCINKESSVSEDFKNLYIKLDKKEWEKHPNGDKDFEINKNLNDIACTLREKWILITQKLIHKIINESDYGKIYELVVFMRELKDKPYGYFLEDNIDDFYKVFQKDSRRIVGADRLAALSLYKGDSFLEIRFLYGMLGCFYGYDLLPKGQAVIKSIENKYMPARYLLNDNLHHSVLDKANFRETKVADFVKIFCQNMPLLIGK